jgi:AraC-like DNA-binding protein
MAQGPTGISAMNLKCVWKVDEGLSYDCPCDRSSQRELIAIRTFEGAGRIYIKDSGIIDIPSALFTSMVYEWIGTWNRDSKITPAQESLERVITLMHQRIQKGFPVREMAKIACLSERGFRQSFRAETGLSPKKYFDRIRLEQARSLLDLGVYSISEVSERLGYANPFHLSRAFKDYYGMAPSKVSR